MQSHPVNRTRGIVRAFAKISDYCRLLPPFSETDNYGCPTPKTVLVEALFSGLVQATQLLANQASVQWHYTDTELILDQGLRGYYQVLIHYGLFDDRYIDLDRNWTFLTFDLRRPLEGPVIWCSEVFDEGQQAASLIHAHDQASSYATEPHGWLMLSGPHGAGKSHLATAIAWKAMESNAVSLRLSASDFQSHHGVEEDAWLLGEQQLLEGADLLVVDDIFPRFGIFRNIHFDKILRVRYHQHKPTVLVVCEEYAEIPSWLSGIETKIVLIASNYRPLLKRK